MENKNNPLISALPPVMDRVSFINAINKAPTFNKLNTIEDRLLEAEKIVSEFFVGLPRHYYFYERVVNKMIESYRIRTPDSLVRKLNGGEILSNEETIELVSDQIRTAPSIFGTYLIGLAGTGKTTIINTILKLFPKVIPQPSLGVLQVPIIRIQTPYRASRKELCKSFFRELDSLLPKSNYSDQFSHYNESDLADQVRRKALCHMIGTIVLDEIQDLKTSKGGPSEMTLAFIKFLTNVVGVPIVFVGSLEAEEILFGNFQLASRSQGFKWERFEKNETWSYFIKSLFSYKVTSEQQELDETISDLYYDLTQGVPRLLNLLHVEAQKICLHNKGKIIKPLDLLVAAKNLFSSTSLVMAGIKNYNTQILSRYPDLLTIENFKKDSDAEPGYNSADSSKGETETNNNTQNASHVPINPQCGEKSGKIIGTRASDLLELIENCSTCNEAYSIFKEHEIIPHISELVEF